MRAALRTRFTLANERTFLQAVRGERVDGDAFRRWLRTEQALRDNASISPPLAVPLLAGFVVTLAALVALVADISPFAHRHLGRHLRLLEVGRARSAPEAVLATALVVVALAVLGVVAVLT